MAAPSTTCPWCQTSRGKPASAGGLTHWPGLLALPCSQQHEGCVPKKENTSILKRRLLSTLNPSMGRGEPLGQMWRTELGASHFYRNSGACRSCKIADKPCLLVERCITLAIDAFGLGVPDSAAPGQCRPSRWPPDWYDADNLTSKLVAEAESFVSDRHPFGRPLAICKARAMREGRPSQAYPWDGCGIRPPVAAATTLEYGWPEVLAARGVGRSGRFFRITTDFNTAPTPK